MPSIHLAAPSSDAESGLEAAGQIGSTQRGALNGEDEHHLAGALQIYRAHGIARAVRSNRFFERYPSQPVEHSQRRGIGWMVTGLLLTPDDKFDRNGRNFAFRTSGRSRSSTLLLTENEIRDDGENLDERLGENAGSFTRTRAGLAVVDASIFYGPTDAILVSSTLGAGAVLQEANALGNRLIGLELDLGIRFHLTHTIALDLVNALLIPGGAAAATVNRIDPDDTRPADTFQASLSAYF